MGDGRHYFRVDLLPLFPFPQRIFATTDLEKKRSQLQDIIDKINAYKKISDLKERQRLNLSVQLESLEAQAEELRSGYYGK